MVRKTKIIYFILFLFLLTNMIFDVFLGKQLLKFHHLFLAGAICLAIAVQGMALTRLFKASFC
ncbi:hypothetical protein C7M51_03417 [Mixta intestinalis]|jgi:hypothetical protein|uniref:Uncharacterized protein n=1 Tax=Mixta intestinalis TaxID=1615494 RepID=A0A6P1Q265_9GAMM|nr:hypothetical protein C7M51_03417 [Mixta intestinalis]